MEEGRDGDIGASKVGYGVVNDNGPFHHVAAIKHVHKQMMATSSN